MINNNPSPVMGGEQKELITRLIVKIDNSIGDLDDVSWGMEEGVLISKRDALSIIALLQASPTPVEPSIRTETIQEVLDLLQRWYNWYGPGELDYPVAHSLVIDTKRALMVAEAIKLANVPSVQGKEELQRYRDNAEEDYMRTPISVLRYISKLETVVQGKEDGGASAINSGEASVAKYISISHNAQIPADKNAIPRTAANIERYLAEQGIKLTMVQGSELHRLV
jgi:hypothetical protein